MIKESVSQIQILAHIIMTNALPKPDFEHVFGTRVPVQAVLKAVICARRQTISLAC